jgi:hypothetical protein
MGRARQRSMRYRGRGWKGHARVGSYDSWVVPIRNQGVLRAVGRAAGGVVVEQWLSLRITVPQREHAALHVLRCRTHAQRSAAKLCELSTP